MKKLKVQVLERIIKHTIHGEADRAARLMEKLIAAVGSMIVNESNYGNTDDPMFPARRELQRELEDDLEHDRVDTELPAEGGELDAELPAGAGEECADGEECEDFGADAVAGMIADLVKAGGVDEEKLAQIVDILVGEMDQPEEPVPGEELPAEEDPAAGEEVPGEGDLPPPSPLDTIK